MYSEAVFAGRNTKAINAEITNTLWIEIDTDLRIILGYQDGVRIKSVVKKVKNDY
jgi:hypothetical protein